MAYNMSAYEREVTITFNEEDDMAAAYCASPKWIRKFDKLVAENPAQFKCEKVDYCEGEIVAKYYWFDKSLFSIRSKTVKRELTAEQKAAQAERMRRVVANRSKTA